ncbi:hypothetical protein AWH48_18340 [Domibacillus aminovorans]|uniref:SLH domain-containing protein n=1 Tax=Domibacillus aminovorans TaxID=29332 RepID=A0A177KZ94_9BACI|nr:S-layer homology domain-containing protein [Domibacillus aminovorans]OAH58335.1 hypothetical protein AWH48_18340 [Domibacillus aminovorans]
MDVGERYDEAVSFLYDDRVVKGISATKFGAQQTLTRGEFANLLYGTFLFILDTFYYPFAESVTITSSTTTQIALEKVVPAHYTAEDIVSYVNIINPTLFC